MRAGSHAAAGLPQRCRLPSGETRTQWFPPPWRAPSCPGISVVVCLLLQGSQRPSPPSMPRATRCTSSRTRPRCAKACCRRTHCRSPPVWGFRAAATFLPFSVPHMDSTLFCHLLGEKDSDSHVLFMFRFGGNHLEGFYANQQFSFILPESTSCRPQHQISFLASQAMHQRMRHELFDASGAFVNEVLVATGQEV